MNKTLIKFAELIPGLYALWAAAETDGREGRIARALPHEPVLELLRSAGRLD